MPSLFAFFGLMWALCLFFTGQRTRAFDVALGTILYLGMRALVREMFFGKDNNEGKNDDG